jgi:hypothetical protein
MGSQLCQPVLHPIFRRMLMTVLLARGSPVCVVGPDGDKALQPAPSTTTITPKNGTTRPTRTAAKAGLLHERVHVVWVSGGLRNETDMSRSAYEIRVLGEVPSDLLLDFEHVTAWVDPVGTTMRVELADEAEMHGLLDALRRASLVLVDVRREQVYDDEIIG